MTLRLPLSENQLVILCDASEHARSYVLVTQDYRDTVEGTRKVFALFAFSSCQVRAGQMSLTTYAKEFLPIHFAFDEFGHIK